MVPQHALLSNLFHKVVIKLMIVIEDEFFYFYDSIKWQTGWHNFNG
jgi:hypothetical protein